MADKRKPFSVQTTQDGHEVEVHTKRDPQTHTFYYELYCRHKRTEPIVVRQKYGSPHYEISIGKGNGEPQVLSGSFSNTMKAFGAVTKYFSMMQATQKAKRQSKENKEDN